MLQYVEISLSTHFPTALCCRSNFFEQSNFIYSMSLRDSGLIWESCERKQKNESFTSSTFKILKLLAQMLVELVGSDLQLIFEDKFIYFHVCSAGKAIEILDIVTLEC